MDRRHVIFDVLDPGLLSMPRPSTGRSVVTRQDRSEFVTGGGIVQMVVGLPTEISGWLIDSILPDSTLTDVLRAIIVDAYHEEKGT